MVSGNCPACGILLSIFRVRLPEERLAFTACSSCGVILGMSSLAPLVVDEGEGIEEEEVDASGLGELEGLGGMEGGGHEEGADHAGMDVLSAHGVDPAARSGVGPSEHEVCAACAGQGKRDDAKPVVLARLALATVKADRPPRVHGEAELTAVEASTPTSSDEPTVAPSVSSHQEDLNSRPQQEASLVVDPAVLDSCQTVPSIGEDGRRFPVVLLATKAEQARKEMAAALTGSGLAGEVIGCEDGEQLLYVYCRLIQSAATRPALVVLDLAMPLVTGQEVAVVIRGIEEGFQVSPVPVLFYGQEDPQRLESFLDYLTYAQALPKASQEEGEGALGIQLQDFLCHWTDLASSSGTPASPDPIRCSQ